jgi:hypothetical protein
MGAIPYEFYRFSYQRAQKHNEAYVSASSGQPEKNMIVTGERGTSEVHHDAFEMSVCQVLVWDSRSVVETSQLERHIPISIHLCTFREFAQHTLAAALQVLQTHQRAVIPVSIVEVIEDSNTQNSVLIRRAWINPSIASLPRHYDNLAAN